MTTTVISDLHLGVSRTAGTTPKSQQALREWQFEMFESLLAASKGRLIINGDLFDTFNVDNATLLRTYEALAQWCDRYDNHKLVLVAGNHDLSKDSGKLSSFHLLGSLLPRPKTQVVLDPVMLADGVYVIPHLPNQDVFDLALEDSLSLKNTVILLHANYDNKWAEKSDGSLNVSREIVAQHRSNGNFLIFGHEHQMRSPEENVLCVGNQIPTSVSDCLGSDRKYICRIEV